MRKRVTYRQEGGDDGFQYVVRVDGREKVNGCNRRTAQYYVRRFRAELGLDPKTEKGVMYEKAEVL